MVDPRRGILLDLFRAALERVDGRTATRRALSVDVASTPSPQEPGARWDVFAAGKAAASMALGAYDALGNAIGTAFIVTKDGHVSEAASRLPRACVFETSHPVPDERSLAAGAALIRWLERSEASAVPLLALVSGGASSLLEHLAPGVTFEQLRATNERGLASGLDIAELNAERSRLSLLKGGGLTKLLQGRTVLALFVSDVPGDDPAVIGSGLLAPVEGDRVERRIVGNVELALAGAADRARERHGLAVCAARERFAGDAVELAARFVSQLESASAPVCLWGGESTVRLPAVPGRGGRNQHLALAAARHVAGRRDMLLLAAGTDGTDGPTADAGALIDSGTWERIGVAGLDAEQCLELAASGEALEASEDLVHTGPTGTNVGDLVIGLRLPPVL